MGFSPMNASVQQSEITELQKEKKSTLVPVAKVIEKHTEEVK